MADTGQVSKKADSTIAKRIVSLLDNMCDDYPWILDMSDAQIAMLQRRLEEILTKFVEERRVERPPKNL